MLPEASQLDPVAIIEAFVEALVSCVLIGSVGAIIHEVDLPLTDLDVCVEETAANILRTVDALEALDAVEGLVDDRGEGGESIILSALRRDPDLIHSRDTWMFLTSHGEIDIVMHPAGFPNGYKDLVDPGVRGVSIADLDDIRRSKELAGRDKDLEALRHFPARSQRTPSLALPPHFEETLRQRSTSRYRKPPR